MEKFILELCSCQLLVTGRQVFINRNFREINVQSISFAVGAKWIYIVVPLYRAIMLWIIRGPTIRTISFPNFNIYGLTVLGIWVLHHSLRSRQIFNTNHPSPRVKSCAFASSRSPLLMYYNYPALTQWCQYLHPKAPSEILVRIMIISFNSNTTYLPSTAAIACANGPGVGVY